MSFQLCQKIMAVCVYLPKIIQEMDIDVSESGNGKDSDPTGGTRTQEIGIQASSSKMNARIQVKRRTSCKGWSQY